MSNTPMHGSDVQETPEWWKASDGRFYPPELHPDYVPPAEPVPVVEPAASEVPAEVPAEPTAAEMPAVSESVVERPAVDGADPGGSAGSGGTGKRSLSMSLAERLRAEADRVGDEAAAAADAGVGRFASEDLDLGGARDTLEGAKSTLEEELGAAGAGSPPEGTVPDPLGDMSDRATIVIPNPGLAAPQSLQSPTPPVPGAPVADAAPPSVPGTSSSVPAGPAASGGPPLPGGPAAPPSMPPQDQTMIQPAPSTPPVAGAPVAPPSVPGAPSSVPPVAGAPVAPPSVPSMPSAPPPVPAAPSSLPGGTPPAPGAQQGPGGVTYTPAAPAAPSSAAEQAALGAAPIAPGDAVHDYKQPATSATANARSSSGPAGLLALVAGAAAIAGSLLQWGRVEVFNSASEVVGFQDVAGFDSSGIWAAIGGAVLLICGVLFLMGIPQQTYWGIGAFIAGAVIVGAVVFSAFDIRGLDDAILSDLAARGELGSATKATSGPLIGLWIAGIGGALGALTAPFVNRS